ncbi:MAG: phosphopantothenoylcysteine decarboxylase [Planctomycetota bacterium]
MSNRPVLLIGGAPRVSVDAVRHLRVDASGATAVALQCRLGGLTTDLLLSCDAAPEVAARRYTLRCELDTAVRDWVADHPQGVVVCSAAINDYTVGGIRSRDTAGGWHELPAGAKLPSGAAEVHICLNPAPKLVDGLRAAGFAGILVAFKYEDARTVIAAASALRARIDAAVVVANSIDGTVQALVDAERVQPYPDRVALLDALARRIATL